jgi:DNA-binding XRE family transcriptional regulator
MSKSVVLLTDRPGFEETWRPVLSRAGLSAQRTELDQLGTRLREGSLALIDAGCDVFDEDELLATVGLCRAARMTCAVALPSAEAFAGIDELLEDLSPGLVVRAARDMDRVAVTLARRADRERSKRFEYVTVSPRPSELLAILADGSALLLPRPVSEEDDGSEVASITLGPAAESALLALSTGRELTLRAADVAPHGATNGARPSVPPGLNGLQNPIAIDGARLGARLRELRVAAGLTQAELARRTGIHRPNIARVEAGRHTPSLETLARLASAIGVPTTSVLEA